MTTLRADDIKQFRTEGWLKLPATMSPAELQQIDQAMSGAADRGLIDWVGKVAKETDTRAVFAEHNAAKRHQMFRNEHDLRLHYPELRAIVTRLATVASQLLDGREVRVVLDQTFVKPAASEGSRPTLWHQDFPYMPLDRRGFLTFWIPVEGVTEASGALRFVPRSHRLGPLGRFELANEPKELNEILAPDDLARVGQPVTVPLATGDITVHDALLIHGSTNNTTPRPRRVWTIEFIPADTLWTGAPFSHARLKDLGMTPFSRFDHPSFSPSPSAPIE